MREILRVKACCRILLQARGAFSWFWPWWQGERWVTSDEGCGKSWQNCAGLRWTIRRIERRGWMADWLVGPGARTGVAAGPRGGGERDPRRTYFPRCSPATLPARVMTLPKSTSRAPAIRNSVSKLGLRRSRSTRLMMEWTGRPAEQGRSWKGRVFRALCAAGGPGWRPPPLVSYLLTRLDTAQSYS